MESNINETKQNPRLKYLTQKELESLFSTVKEMGNIRDIAIFQIGYYCGLRASEVGLIKRFSYDQRAGKLFIERLKGSTHGTFFLDPPRKKALDNYLKNHRVHDTQPLFLSRLKLGISRFTLHKMINKYGKLAGLRKSKRHWHVLRHSIAVQMLDSGIGIEDVRNHLGHRCFSSTVIYVAFTATQKRRLFNSMENSTFICK